MKEPEKVSIVFNTKSNERVGKFYTRLGDAQRCAEKLNQWQRNTYEAKEMTLIDFSVYETFFGKVKT